MSHLVQLLCRQVRGVAWGQQASAELASRARYMHNWLLAPAQSDSCIGLPIQPLQEPPEGHLQCPPSSRDQEPIFQEAAAVPNHKVSA